MPMRYANQDDVLRDLKLSVSNPSHAAAIAEVVRIENGVCLNLDRKMGRSFGVPQPVTVTILATGYTWLLLPYPFRMVTAITIDGVAIAAESWAPGNVGRDGQFSMLRPSVDLFSGLWYGEIDVTGVPADADLDEPIPADLSLAAGFITADQYRINHSGPSGEIGPDGLVLPTRNPWRFEIVKEAIRAHQVTRRKVAV